MQKILEEIQNVEHNKKKCCERVRTLINKMKDLDCEILCDNKNDGSQEQYDAYVELCENHNLSGLVFTPIENQVYDWKLELEQILHQLENL